MGTSVESIENESFVKIYPNPSNGTIFIEFENPVQSDIRIEITNISGQKVYIKEFNSQKVIEHIDLSNLPIGIYTIVFISENLVKTDKIILNE